MAPSGQQHPLNDKRRLEGRLSSAIAQLMGCEEDKCSEIILGASFCSYKRCKQCPACHSSPPPPPSESLEEKRLYEAHAHHTPAGPGCEPSVGYGFDANGCGRWCSQTSQHIDCLDCDCVSAASTEPSPFIVRNMPCASRPLPDAHTDCVVSKIMLHCVFEQQGLYAVTSLALMGCPFCPCCTERYSRVRLQYQ